MLRRLVARLCRCRCAGSEELLNADHDPGHILTAPFDGGGPMLPAKPVGQILVARDRRIHELEQALVAARRVIDAALHKR